jgi:predicted CopG family antitoxin
VKPTSTLKVASETRDKLRALKRGGETYDAVIKRLIEKEKMS